MDAAARIKSTVGTFLTFEKRPRASHSQKTARNKSLDDID